MILFLSMLAAADQLAPQVDLSRPAAIIDGSISNLDYPRSARFAGEEGNVTIRYLINLRGRVTECTIEESSGSSALDRRSCAIWTSRLLYRPARDANGRPTTQSSTQRFRWRIESDCGEDFRGMEICIIAEAPRRRN
jgi:TonB family protein